MKKLISFLLAILICLGCLVPAFAEETADPTETTEAAQTTSADEEETAAPTADTSGDPMGPEAASEPEFEEDYYYSEAYYTSLESQYIRWKGDRGDNARYHRAYRQFYATDPDLTIVDHMVFKKHEKTRWSEAYYALLDYFDTDEAEALAWTLKIPSEVNGLPVSLRLYGDDDYADGFFYNCYSNDTVHEIILDEGFTGVASYAFTNFTALWTVKLPTTVTTVGYGAFQGCKNLRKIVGGENITTVRGLAFDGCAWLSSFPHMETLKVIEGNAFSGCAFKKLTLSGNVSLSGGDEDNYSAWSAFEGCRNLQKVTFLDGSKKKPLWIGHSTFKNCTALKTVVFPKKCSFVDIFDLAFSGCTALETVKNTDKLTGISRFGFENCISLKSIVLPAGIKSVSEDAFKGCKNLKAVELKSADIDLFGRKISSGWIYGADTRGEVSGNFVQLLPKTCTVYVVNKNMKTTVKNHGFKGKVQIKVDVKAPKTLKETKHMSTKQENSVRLQWSAVKNADGYRVYAVNAKTGKLTALKTVKAPTTCVTLKTTGKTFAVKAFRKIDGDVSWSKATTN